MESPITFLAINVLVIGKVEELTTEIRNNLSQVPGCKVVVEANAEKARDLLNKKTIDCVIFDFATLGVVQVAIVRSVCMEAKIPVILVFADSGDQGAIDLLAEDKNLIFIEKPSLNLSKDISGLCSRLMNHNDPKFHREELRLPTNQMASIVLESGRHYDGKIINMNSKGACIEINTCHVKKSDKIKILILLEKLNRQRTLMAEVKWTKDLRTKSIIGVGFL